MSRWKAKRLLVLGGGHGVGKTTLARALQGQVRALVSKQRAELVAVASPLGLTWPELARYHDELVVRAADELLDRFVGAPEIDLLVIDCHYAIPSWQSLRPRREAPACGFFADLDARFAGRLSRAVPSKWFLLEASMSTSFMRCLKRDPGGWLGRPVYPLSLLHEQAAAEREYFRRMCDELQVSKCAQHLMKTDAPFGEVLTEALRLLDDSRWAKATA